MKQMNISYYQMRYSYYEEEWEDGNDIKYDNTLPYLLTDEDVEIIKRKVINASIKAIDAFISGNKDILDIYTLNYNKGCSVTIDEDLLIDEDLQELWNGYIGDICEDKNLIDELKKLKEKVSNEQLTVSFEELKTYQLKNKKIEAQFLLKTGGNYDE